MQSNALRQNLISLPCQELAYSLWSRTGSLSLPAVDLDAPYITQKQHLYKVVAIVLKLLLSACLILTLSACGGGDSTETTTEPTTETTTVEIVTENPEGISGNSTSPAPDDALKAAVSIDSGTPPIPLTIGLINTSGTPLELSKAKHSITITFTYTNPLNTKTVILATATKEFDLSDNSDALNFEKSDYDISGHDDDNDGFSNLVEVIANTDPTDDNDTPLTCRIDDTNSLIGSCSLG